MYSFLNFVKKTTTNRVYLQIGIILRRINEVNKYKVLSIAIAVGLASSVATAAVTKDLAYKSSGLSANDVAAQNYFVNHFYSFSNYAITKKGKDITALILRAKGSSPLTLTLERYLNNAPTAAGVNAQDLAISAQASLKVPVC